MQATKEWLDALKPEDKVSIHTSSGGACIGKVVRRTSTQIIVQPNLKDERYTNKFDSVTGKLKGGDIWHMVYIEPVTQEVYDTIEKTKLVHRLSRIDWQTLPLPLLRELTKVLAERKE